MRPFFLRLIEPKSESEDTRRSEFIFNILLFATLFLIFSAIVNSAVTLLFLSDAISRENNAVSFILLFIVFFFFFSLYFLSQRGYFRPASYIFIGIFFSLASYMSYRWGVDVSASLLFYAITIVMAGVLISTRVAFLTTLCISSVIGIIAYLQVHNMVEPNRYWTTELWHSTDVIVTSLLFLIIATVSWLSNREIEKSLIRARKSEAELKEERDMLEVRVTERTRELQKVELEKLSQMYRFVEFGKVASGLFHDLVNPLSALSLNIESIAKTYGTDHRGEFANLRGDVARAQRATAHMQQLLLSMRKHLSREGTREHFSINRTIQDISRVLCSYARKHGISIVFTPFSELSTYGDTALFTQIISNLISNAIESYTPDSENHVQRQVHITLSEKNGEVELSVTDSGIGISENVLEKIFEPFFTTKSPGKGLGIGLAVVKRAVEKEFNGSLSVNSTPGVGSTFTVHFPLQNHDNT